MAARFRSFLKEGYWGKTLAIRLTLPRGYSLMIAEWSWSWWATATIRRTHARKSAIFWVFRWPKPRETGLAKTLPDTYLSEYLLWMIPQSPIKYPLPQPFSWYHCPPIFDGPNQDGFKKLSSTHFHYPSLHSILTSKTPKIFLNALY